MQAIIKKYGVAAKRAWLALAWLLLWVVMGMSTAGYDLNKLAELAQARYGDEAHQNILELQALVTQLKGASEAEKLKGINDFFNQQINFVDDMVLWKQADYWETPLEFIGLKAGDCEDFSIAKYAFLKAVDIPNDKLRLTYVRAETNRQGMRLIRAHMVLSYYATPQSDPLILDNLNHEILPASSRRDLFPVFSFNDKGLWASNGGRANAGAQSSLSRWRDVLTRMQADGIE